MKLFLTMFVGYAIGLGLIYGAQGCGPAHSSGVVSASAIQGPAGVSCYAIFEDGKAVGGNCK